MITSTSGKRDPFAKILKKRKRDVTNNTSVTHTDASGADAKSGSQAHNYVPNESQSGPKYSHLGTQGSNSDAVKENYNTDKNASPKRRASTPDKDISKTQLMSQPSESPNSRVLGSFSETRTRSESEAKTRQALSTVRVVEQTSENRNYRFQQPKPFRLIDPDVSSTKSGDKEKATSFSLRQKQYKVTKNKHSKKYTVAIDTKKNIRDYTDKELTEKHKRADNNLINSWKSIISKYERLGDVDNGSDIIDLHTGKIVEDNGHIRSLAQQDTLKSHERRNKLTKSSTCNDDDFLTGLVEANVVKEAVRQKFDLKRLKTDGILPGLELDLSESDSEDASYVMSSDHDSSSDTEAVSESESDISDVEVDNEIEGKDYSESEEEENGVAGLDKDDVYSESEDCSSQLSGIAEESD